MVKISFYGAAGEVTGSNFLVTSDNHKYIVDCGLFQGLPEITRYNTEQFAYNPKEVEAVIVTHAHLDHVGRLPKLVKEGFHGPIFATEATIELAGLVLDDAEGLMHHHFEQSNHPVLYDRIDLERTKTLFRAVPYHKPFRLPTGDTVTFFDAGHILGSATILFETGGKRLVFSGDIGHWPGTILPHPETPLEADCVMVEGTYGSIEHKERQDRLTVLKDALDWTAEHRGVLLIPAFAVERTQEVLYLLHHLFTENQLPKMPVFVDSPLAIEALEVFERHLELFRREIRDEHDHNFFSFRSLALTPTVEQSKEINDLPPPKVIIAGSGMMQGGRIEHHLKHYLDKPNTYLLVIGYQAEGTIGQRIISGQKVVEIHGEQVSVRAHVVNVDAFSSHADDSELIAWLKQIKFQPNSSIVITHSDLKRSEPFAQELAKQFPNVKTHVAQLNQSLDLQ